MGYLQVLAMAVVERRRELENLAEVSGTPAADEIMVFVRRLLSHLVRADGSVSMEELMILCGFNRDSHTWPEEIDSARDTVRDTPAFATEVPAFLRAAKAYDQRTGGATAPAMRRSIRALCETVVTADAYTHPHERVFVDALLVTLESA